MWEVSIGSTLNVSPQAVFILLFKHCLSMFWNFAKDARPENPRDLSLPLLSTGVAITQPSLAN